MSRSDFWSIAATLIVTGVAYFVGGPKTAYGCIALGVATALYLLLTRKKGEPASVNTTATAKSAANPVMSASPRLTANPKQSQAVHVHLPSTEKKEPPRVRPTKAKPPHNLGLHSCKMLQIDESLGEHGEMGGFHPTDDQSQPNAAVVCIKNRSKEGEVATVEDVRAALVFRDGNGKEFGEGVHQALWVNNQLWNASFALEETKCLIVAFLHFDQSGQISEVMAPYIREHRNGFLTVEPYRFDEDVSTVEVILVSGNSRVMEPMMFEFFVEDGKTGIRLVSDEEDP